MRRPRLAVRLAPAAVLACGGGPADGFTATMDPALTTVSAANTASSSSGDASSSSSDTTASDASSSSPAASTGTLYDLGTAQDVAPEQPPPGCKDKIDFLFVIQRISQPPEIQQRLIDAFPAFIGTIQDKFAGFDVHIMVTDSDPYWGLQACDPAGCAEADYDGCFVGDKAIPDYPCLAYQTITKCDHTLGAGTVFNAGRHASNVPCQLDGGRRYITQDQTDLVATFTCMARVGGSGGDRIGATIVQAVSPKLNQAGGCNESFVRDDALLMITFIAPYGDNASEGTPQDWADAVFAAKHGNKDSVIMLGIGGDADDGPKLPLLELLSLFPNSLRGFTTDPDYGAVFADAVTLVDKACEGFIPPG